MNAGFLRIASTFALVAVVVAVVVSALAQTARGEDLPGHVDHEGCE
ncbi:hypothetical protein ACIBQ0_09800 [Nocardia nova]